MGVYIGSVYYGLYANPLMETGIFGRILHLYANVTNFLHLTSKVGV